MAKTNDDDARPSAPRAATGGGDKATGEEIASIDLPRGAIGTPMTYMLDGKQYIALTIGGSPVPELIAFALS